MANEGIGASVKRKEDYRFIKYFGQNLEGVIADVTEKAQKTTMVADVHTDGNSGKVLEVIQSPDYTYLRVTGDKEPLWLASLKIDVVKGATVKYSSGMVMSKFYSKSLDRTFDTIIFVDSIAPEKK